MNAITTEATAEMIITVTHKDGTKESARFVSIPKQTEEIEKIDLTKGEA